MKPRLIVITGLTASGKSSIAMKLAQRINGRLLTADSTQLIKQVSILSNKANCETALLNSIDGFKYNSVVNYSEKLLDAAKEIAKTQTPILEGGTAYYVKMALNGGLESRAPKTVERALKEFDATFADANLAEEIYLETIRRWPHKRLELKNITTDKHRLRAAFIKAYCEVLEPENKQRTRGLQNEFETWKYSIYMEREELLARIYERVNVMLKQPDTYKELVELCEEYSRRRVKEDLRLKQMTLFKIIGVKETLKLLADAPRTWNSMKELKKLIKATFANVMIHTRNYSKRQYDWMKVQTEFFPIINSATKEDEIVDLIENQLKNFTFDEHLKLCKSQAIPIFQFATKKIDDVMKEYLNWIDDNERLLDYMQTLKPYVSEERVAMVRMAADLL